MSLFGFRSKKNPAPAAPVAPPPNFLHVLLRQRALYPALPVTAGQSKALARQLDVTLMKSGFKLSPALLSYLGNCDFASALGAAQHILAGAQQIVGDHVTHNPYFATFPRGVPDTTDFWIDCLLQYYINDEEIYGEHRHSFEEMVRCQPALQLKTGVQLKVIHLGGPLEAELQALFASLAGATIPLNAEDRTLLAALFERGCTSDVPVRIRENKAILNALRLRKAQPIEVDTVVDVLRLACVLSDGDVTLAQPTKFRSFPRPVRRQLVETLDQLVARDPRKVDDASNYKERFKRLAEKLHPREHVRCEHAARLFDFTGGKIEVETFNRRAHEAVVTGRRTGDFRPAVGVLSDRPGFLLKHVDLVLRSGDRASAAELLHSFRARIAKISGRNLLNLDQHLANRTSLQGSRIFVNRHGRGHASATSLPVLAKDAIAPFRAAIQEEIVRRLPDRSTLVVDWPSLAGIAVPLSEKSKSDGFAVLPRGSTFPVTHGGNRSLRFFFYWKERAERTDYDLSCACYDAQFNLVTQVSWTNLRDGNERDPVIVHSGDFTSASEGASEFIDIDLQRLDPRITYLLPTVNFFAGEDFAAAEEAFFGFMERPARDRGLPFEARTVTTKFALKGTGKVCVPMVFVCSRDTVTGKWLDLYARGLFWANRVEDNAYSTISLAKAILEKTFTPLTELVKLHQRRAATTLAANEPWPDSPVTYIGFRRPEGLHPDSTVITLESFRTLIPA